MSTVITDVDTVLYDTFGQVQGVDIDLQTSWATAGSNHTRDVRGEAGIKIAPWRGTLTGRLWGLK